MRGCAAALLLLLMAPPASATDLEQCKAIEDAGKRLACFDALAPAPPDDGGEAVLAFPLQSRLLSPFTELKRGTRFVLENGQVWQAVGPKGGYYTSVPEKPQVTIEESYLGAYWLTIEGVNANIRVKRVK